MAVLLALTSSVLWGTADYFGGVLSKRIAAVAVVLVSQAIALVAIVPAAWAAGAFDDPSGYLPWGIAAGVVGPIGLISFYRALATGTMGVVSPIAATGIVVPVLWGLVLQGDRPSFGQYAGILLGFVGVVLASGPDLRGGTGSASWKPIALALVAALGFGGSFICLDGGAQYSIGMTLVVQRSTSVLALVVPVLLVTRLKGMRWRDLGPLAGVGFGDAAANGTFAWAATLGLLSVTSVLGSLYPVATLLLARGLLGERLSPLQRVGVTLALAGVLLLAASGA
jgi:drug/metabolite transporter (DMT)-like permease